VLPHMFGQISATRPFISRFGQSLVTRSGTIRKGDLQPLCSLPGVHKRYIPLSLLASSDPGPARAAHIRTPFLECEPTLGRTAP
jgi:hypothetical protein